MKSRAQRIILAGGLALAYLYSFPYFEVMGSANELPRVYLTVAMVDEGTTAINSGVNRWGCTADVTPDCKNLNDPAIVRHSNKAPGSSFLAAPAYLALKGVKKLFGSEPTLAEMTWVFRVATGVVPTLLFLLLLWHFLSRFCPEPGARRLALVGYALGTLAMPYSILFFSHQLSAILVGTAYILFVWIFEEGLDERWLSIAGLAAGAAPLVDYQAAFAGVPLAVYVIASLVKRRRRRWSGLLRCAVGAAVPIAILLWYHAAAFGSPFTTGYAVSETFKADHQAGLLGMDRPRWLAFSSSMWSAENGLFFFCPMLLLAGWGWVILARKKLWWHFGITLSVFLVYVAFISSIRFYHGGWQVGPRYITAMVPFAMVPVSVAIARADEQLWTRSLVVGLVGVGVVAYATTCALFPHFPDPFTNPLYGVTFRLLADGHAPYNAGWLFGLRGVASLVPYLLVVGGLLGWVALRDRQHWRSGALGLALAAAILAAYSLAPRGEPRATERSYNNIVKFMKSL